MSVTLSKTARSTLAPGMVPAAIVSLREAAVREMDAEEAGKREVSKITFDHKHDGRGASHDDDDNWVARYPGQNSPHIGNGSGGAR